ncbi:RDD family protein [Streptomyces sp. SAS_272]|uniref:RDD family protein n=1 Tax=Streptomyces sp. SAS_272 TaxID=3412747 RepID=UPI00403C1DD6
MSAPTPAPGDDRPREGYYPDPSIPGYVRYWNGSAWVPGTSRPAPSDGRPLTAPSGGGPASPVEETGPHFFDEDPVPGGPPPANPYGGHPEPASAWGADRSHQSGFGGDQDRRVSWGGPPAADPRVPLPAQVQPEGASTSTDGMTTIPPAEPEAGAGDVVSGGTFVFRRPTAGGGGAAPAGAAAGPAPFAPAGHTPDQGTVTFRPPAPRTGGADGGYPPGAQGPTTAPPGFGAGKAAADRASAAPGPGVQAPQGPAQIPSPQNPAQAAATPAPQGPGFPPEPSAPSAAHPAGPPVARTPASASGPASAPSQPAPGVPRRPADPGGPGAAQPRPATAAATPATPAAPAPMAAGSGGGQPSWAQQVHRLTGAEDGPVTPWKPPVDDVFQAAARRQAEARPAGLGKRLAARLVDTFVLAAVTAGAALPLGVRALDHVDEKIDAAKLSGETVTVWLLDGTTSVYLGIVLAVLLVFGIVYEALPTAKWGRTLGKKLLGLQVRDIEGGEPPSYGAALRRWLVYSVPGLLAVGVVGVLWGLFDRPWRQCWHDKAAHTFVAG